MERLGCSRAIDTNLHKNRRRRGFNAQKQHASFPELIDGEISNGKLMVDGQNPWRSGFSHQSSDTFSTTATQYQHGREHGGAEEVLRWDRVLPG